jgi:hypothetical protein
MRKKIKFNSTRQGDCKFAKGEERSTYGSQSLVFFDLALRELPGIIRPITLDY